MSPETPDRRSRRRLVALPKWLTRPVRAVVALLLLSLLAVWYAAETDFAAERVRRLLEARGADLLGVPLVIDRLEMDLLPPRLQADGVRAEGRASADRVVVEVDPLGLLRNRISLANLELHRPRLDLDLQAPEPSDGGSVQLLPLELRRLLVQDGELRFGGETARFSGELLDIGARMAPESSGLIATAPGSGVGELNIGGGSLQLRHDDGSTEEFRPIEVRARYGLAGRTLRLDDLHLVAGESSVDASGTLRGLRTADLEVAGDVAVADVFKLWVPPGPPDHAGRAAFRGSLQMRDGSPVLAGRIVAGAATIGGLQVDSLVAGLELHREALSLRSVSAALYGGQLAGELYVDRRQQPPRVLVDYRGDGIDAASLTRWSALRGWRLAGSLSGEGSIAWSKPFAASADGSGRIGLQLGVSPPAGGRSAATPAADPQDEAVPAGHRVPALPIPATVDFDYRIDGGALQVREAAVRVRGATVSANGRVDLDGAVALGVRVEGSDLALVDHLVSQYRAFREQRASSRRLGLSGAGTVDLQVTGTLRQLELAGTARGRALAVDDLEIGDVSATLHTEGRALVAEQLVATHGGGSATGTARLRLPGGDPVPGGVDFDVMLQLQAYGVEARRGLGGLPYDARAASTGPFRIRGNWPAPPTLEFDLRAEDAVIGDLQLAELQLRGRRSEAAWLLDGFRATGLGGRVEGSGMWGTREPRLLLDATATGIDVAAACDVVACETTFAGALDAQARIDGRLDALGGELSMIWSGAAAAGVPLGRIVAAARGESGVFAARVLGSERGDDLSPPEVPRTTAPGTAPTLLPEPPQGWSAALTLGSRAPWPTAVRIRAGAGLSAALLGHLGRPLPAGVEIGGQLDLRARGELWDWQAWQGEATVAGLRLQRDAAVLATSERVEATLQDGVLSAIAALRTDAGTLAIDLGISSADGALRGRMDGAFDVGAVELWFDGVEGSGSLSGQVAIAGTLSDPQFTGGGAVRALSLDGGWMYPLTEASGEFEMASATIRVTEFRGLLGGRPFRLSGEIPIAAAGAGASPAARLRLETDELDVMPVVSRSEALARLFSSGSVAGAVELQAESTDWRAWTADIDVTGLVLRMRDYRLDLAAPVRVRLRDGGLDIPAATMTDARTRLAIGGRIELSPLTLDLAARGPLGFEPLNVLSARWGAGGVADVDVAIRGDAGDLAWRGRATVRDAVVSPPVLRQPIDGIRAEVIFDDRRIRIDEGTGELGGGEVELGGEVLLRDNAVQAFRLTAGVSGALLRLERDVQIRASADVVHDGTPQRSLLSGSVILEEGLYRRELRPDSALLELLEAPETDPDPLLQSIDFNLRLRGDGDLIIDNNLANVEVTADLDVRGTAAKPVLLGRSVIRSGRLFWNGNTFDVLQGTVEYNNPFETDPVFDIRSRTEIRRYTIDLTFYGSLQRGVRFNYTSTPPLSELDLFNLLAFNEEPGSTVLEDPTAYQRALGLQATRYLTDAYLSEVERGAARLFGIDRFRIAPTLSGTETDATARLTVGKRINRNLYVTYSRLLSTSEDQLLIVEYQLSPAIRIKGTREEDGSFGIDFFVQKRIR